jgi:hypothetical protein
MKTTRPQIFITEALTGALAVCVAHAQNFSGGQNRVVDQLSG